MGLRTTSCCFTTHRGAAESIIRNVDKRTSRRENRAAFKEGIAQFREMHGLATASEELTLQGAEVSNVHEGPDDQVVRVFVRKRPIFAHELEQKEFDVISCDKVNGDLYIHDARMEADMKGRYLNNHRFKFTKVFSEKDESDLVFTEVVQPLVNLVRQGGNGTVLMYGQTGSGKTYTMSHIYYRAAWSLFEAAANHVEGPAVQHAWISFVELTGDTCADSLNDNHKLQLLTCPNGDVMTFPAVQVEVSSPQELHDCIKFACSVRATAATGVHDQSSRSHAICRVEMENGNALTMVDLAGSEHRIDSAEHDAQRRKESAQINSSLMKLKECIRARAKQADYIPYRQSKLTHLLRPSFVEDADTKSRTVIIATVSPSSKDTEHSLNTIRHSCIMDGQDQPETETRWVSGGVTTRQNLPPVDVTMLARQRKAKQQQKPPEQGPGWGSAPSRFHARDGSFDNVARAASQKKALAAKDKKRRQAENVARKKLSIGALRKLDLARQQLGSRQRERMNRLQFEAQERARKEADAAAKAPPLSSEPPKSKTERKLKPPPKTIEPELQSQRQTQLKSQNQTQSKAKSKTCIADKTLASQTKPATQDRPQVDLDALRTRVWQDPNVPDDQKEEYIVMLVQKARARARASKQEPMASKPVLRAAHAARVDHQVDIREPKPLTRHEKAQQARQKLLEKEHRQAQAKLDRKMESHSSMQGGNNMDELRGEVGRLHAQLQQTTDQVAKFALKQQYNRTKASLLRLERQRKQAHALPEPTSSPRGLE
ncbi:Kinesin-related protein 6 [Hondaea fermentalgiana]|uniref:Kinesin-related protein 6 n=1 Tax=Hondaea fermentalgiana TaxID=2315210 RepID=A0A2R5G9R5_9STRA|nr:Kinesin-related protein 6 [Hondaea fermentalgiana]|eukprot:GBG27770.1 Kinesin-related protein 6 [Hondaea fermentalgiana]